MHGTIIYVILSTFPTFYIRKKILRTDEIPNMDMGLNKHIKGLKHCERKPTSILMQSYHKGQFSIYQREDSHILAWFSLYCYFGWSFQHVRQIKLFNEKDHI